MPSNMSLSDSNCKILARAGAASIAYYLTPGHTPTVVFMTGFMSDMSGGKALALETMCRDRGQAFLRFDYSGHGLSEGEFADGTIGSWAEDALFAIDSLTQGPLILVGSSMGGWIMLLTALARADRIAGLVGIAPAPDFTDRLYHDELTEAQRAEMDRTGKVVVPSAYEDDYVFTRALIEDGRDHFLLDGEIALDCPIRLIHGQQDDAVPWQTSLKIAEMARSRDVEVTLVKGGDHRLSELADLERLTAIVRKLLDQAS